jgi:cold shock CspA family protein
MSTLESNQRHKGHVKFFNSTKGFGFILPETKDDENTDKTEGKNSHRDKTLKISYLLYSIEVFVHHTAIHNDGGFKSLAEVYLDI